VFFVEKNHPVSMARFPTQGVQSQFIVYRADIAVFTILYDFGSGCPYQMRYADGLRKLRMQLQVVGGCQMQT
jgi:hypothetical protein